MDVKEQYEELTQMLQKSLPLKAFPIRDLIQIFRDKGNPITLKTELTISSVHNSGDISGIMCVVGENKENVIACALTHLIFKTSCPLYKEISDYQKKRINENILRNKCANYGKEIVVTLSRHLSYTNNEL